MGISEEESETESEEISETIKTENAPFYLISDTKPQIQETQKTPRINVKKQTKMKQNETNPPQKKQTKTKKPTPKPTKKLHPNQKLCLGISLSNYR